MANPKRTVTLKTSTKPPVGPKIASVGPGGFGTATGRLVHKGPPVTGDYGRGRKNVAATKRNQAK